jgi:hypothetical protein
MLLASCHSICHACFDGATASIVGSIETIPVGLEDCREDGLPLAAQCVNLVVNLVLPIPHVQVFVPFVGAMVSIGYETSDTIHGEHFAVRRAQHTQIVHHEIHDAKDGIELDASA